MDASTTGESGPISCSGAYQPSSRSVDTACRRPGIEQGPRMQGFIQAQSFPITVGALHKRFLNRMMFHILLLWDILALLNCEKCLHEARL